MPKKRDISMLKVNKQKFLIAIGNAGKTLQELSEESKVGYSTICQMRRGLYMKPWKLGKVCKALGVRVEDVVELEESEGDTYGRLSCKAQAGHTLADPAPDQKSGE